MNLESQVCSLELSKRLKELGVKQKSLFYWIRVETENKNIDGFGLTYIINIFKPIQNFKEIYSAFTVSELGEILPDNCYTQKNCARITVDWICHHIIDDDQEDIWIGESEADARAKMLVYILKNKLMELPNE